MSQIKLLQDIISDVRRLGDSLQAYADTFAENEKAAPESFNPEDFEEIYPASGNAEINTVITLPDVRAVLAEKSRNGYKDEVKTLLQKHGAEKLSELAESEYAAVMKEAEKLGS
ncbi:MAG: rRNA biogenesis protein rrp5 [Ruminococcus sp.]|nr:rRNA biogenesis protein rrp5 [Ruminococcus sp.]